MSNISQSPPSTLQTNQGATLITAPNPANMSPLEAAMMDACNLLHEAVAAGDESTAARLRTDLDRMLDKYEACNADDHPQPKWACPHQRALAMSAAGDIEAAIRFEQQAVPHAATPRQREISLGNLSERCIRTAPPRYDEAIDYFLEARVAAPTSVPILLTGAQALYLAGYRAQADRIFGAMVAQPKLLTPGSELTAYIDFESRLAKMRADLPNLDRLMTAWESLSRGSEVSRA